MSDVGTPEVAADPAVARKEQQAQDLARARDAGWTDRMPFMYESVVGGTPAEDETRDTAVWLSDAAIYEWDDEFGDVGEPNPELEKMLFQDEYLQRAGGAIKALSFDVSLEGPNKISPVRNVSHFTHNLSFDCANHDSLRMLAFTL
jgi:ATP-dependent RNA helicase DDX3X